MCVITQLTRSKPRKISLLHLQTKMTRKSDAGRKEENVEEVRTL